MSKTLHEDQKNIPGKASPQDVFISSKRRNCFWRLKKPKVGEQTAVSGKQHGQKIEKDVIDTDVLETVILTGPLAKGRRTLKESNENAVTLPARLSTKMFKWGTACLKLSDIVAVSYNDGSCQFTVHSFPILKSLWSYKRKLRKQKDLHFLAQDADEASKWIEGFESQQCFINHTPVPPESKRQSSRIDTHDSPPRSHAARVMLVIINPRSGHGRARKVFSSEVEPILKLAGINLNVVETTGPHHAQKLAANIDFSTCANGIICVGGDGIVNEVVNGLLSREHNEKQFKEIPIGVIPAGSDNSLCWSVMGVRDPSSAALAIVKGELMLTDVFAVEWMNTGDVHMGHTIAYYGFMSDVLELSEKYQKRFGPLRYFFAGARKFICLPAYECEVEYLPANKEPQQDGASKDESCIVPSIYSYHHLSGDMNIDLEAGAQASGHECGTMAGRKTMGEYTVRSGTVDVSNESSDYVRGLDAKLKRISSIQGIRTASESEDVVTVNNCVVPSRSPSPRPRTRSKSKVDRGWSGVTWDYSMLGGEDHTGEMLRVSEEVRTELKHDPTGCIDINHHGPQTNPSHIDLEAGLSQEAHDAKWVFKKGTFLAALVCNHQCRTVQCMESQLLAPGARHDDGNLDLLLIHKVGRLQLLRFLILMQFGQHVSLPFVEYTKVKAVKLMPGNSKHKKCGIDGELMSLNEPISITVLRERCHLIGQSASSTTNS